MKPLRRSPLPWAFALALLLVLYGGYLNMSERPQRGLPEKAVIVTNGRGAVRRSRAANSGMLFMFPKAEVVEFWMKDTILPLDMIFIRANRVADSTARDQPPFSLANMSSAGPVIGLKAGDKVTGWFLQLE